MLDNRLKRTYTQLNKKDNKHKDELEIYRKIANELYNKYKWPMNIEKSAEFKINYEKFMTLYEKDKNIITLILKIPVGCAILYEIVFWLLLIQYKNIEKKEDNLLLSNDIRKCAAYIDSTNICNVVDLIMYMCTDKFNCRNKTTNSNLFTNTNGLNNNININNLTNTKNKNFTHKYIDGIPIRKQPTYPNCKNDYYVINTLFKEKEGYTWFNINFPGIINYVEEIYKHKEKKETIIEIRYGQNREYLYDATSTYNMCLDNIIKAIKIVRK
jgi:hypothetical protein